MSLRKSVVTVAISHVKVCRRLPRRTKVLLAMTQHNKIYIFELKIILRLETPILARWFGGVTFLKADFESVILNFELELLN